MATKLESGRVLLSEVELRKFYSFCLVDLETGCWNWTGIQPKRSKYGVWHVQLGKQTLTRPAYWFAYNHFVGAVPTGLELAHYNFSDGTSDKCAFWEHVRPATHAENAYDRTKGSCKYGHDVQRWGRYRSGGCNVCNRVRQAKINLIFVYECCGYYPCKC